jgi:hypothetical protein
MNDTREFLRSLGLPGEDPHLPITSNKRFADGAEYRIEIPSTEGPRPLRALLEEAARLKVPIHRVSQGSGIMLLTDGEIREMLQIGRDHGCEVSLFVGPRAAWDIGGQALTPAGRIVGSQHRGTEGLVHAVEDIKRGCELGLRGILVADWGLLQLVGQMKQWGALPKNLVVKTSVMLPAANPATARLLQDLGAGTVNVPVDLTLPQMGAIRQAIDRPIDLYIEAPDNLGGFIRYYELPELVRVTAPLYVKLGLRNSPDIYPSGTHLESTAVALSIERVRRARIALDLLARYAPNARTGETGAPDLGIPEV